MAGSTATTGAQGAEGAAPPVVVKKYANRRLYNTEASSYVTLDDLAKMVRLGRDFVVYDAKTGDDITRSVLTQIIVEAESKEGQSLLPTPFLRQLIGYYGGNLQGLVPRYLEFAMASFGRQQDQMRRTMEQTMGGLIPFPANFGNLEELGKQNMAMMERAMTLFAPFARRDDAAEGGSDREAMRAEIEALRQELARLKGKPPKD
ncbi:polyhydroxyalkanoate synthesis repressor PhaR [Roseomonas sp. HF4]|uniref:polyhydroxyalkanoate synthesis repressor PhaR n=1 Tax=Roseomonas sp. HF4 TaxID=2562313 RepID=UPI0010BF99A1|nr:polyhydroxyalkanoate synthesis repressor PhaR [Roseomonas sp. HF4]